MESQPGQGTTFQFTICLVPAPPTAAPKVPNPPSLAGRRVLVVDDLAINRQILGELLSRVGARVEPADTVETALSALRDQRDSGYPCQLLVLDSQMPGEHGPDLLEILNREPGYSTLPVILLGKGERRCYELAETSGGRIVCLMKPIKRRPLWNALDSLLGYARSERRTARSTRTHLSRFVGDGSGPAGLSILIADDAKENIMLIQAYLKQTPHRLKIAENGASAVELFKQDGFDLVLMDVQMPIMDGYTATGLIREWEREQGRSPTPIIALTANALKEDEQRSLDAGCTGHLTKPIRKSVLLVALQQYSSLPPA